MQIEIQVLFQDGHKNVVVLNWLVGYQPFPSFVKWCLTKMISLIVTQ